jgi:hypothetical protein
VVPQDRFGQRGEVVVSREPRVTPPPAWRTAPTALPPTPRLIRQAITRADEERRADGRDGRRDGRRDGNDDDRDGRWAGRGDNRPAPAPAVNAQPAPVTTSPQPGFVRQPATITTLPPAGFQRDPRGGEGRMSREAFEERQQRFQERRRDEGHRPVTVQAEAQPFSQRGGAAGAMEAAAARAQAQMPRPVPAAVAPPAPRAMPTPPPVSAVQSPPPPPPSAAAFSRPAPAPVPQTMHRGDDGPRHRGNVRQMER